MRIGTEQTQREILRGRRASFVTEGHSAPDGYREAMAAAQSVLSGTESRLRQIADMEESDSQAKAAAEKGEEGSGDRTEALKIYEAVASGKENPVKELRQPEKVPYGHLAQDGIITYNGVCFICDERSNSICLGDMTDKKQVLNIPLSGGGSLKVNRNNLGDLSRAVGMFSPEDINLIMRAIAQDTKVQSMQKEIEDTEASVGNSLTE